METITFFLLSSIMIFIGFLFGLSKRIENSEDDVKDAFKRGYIDGYMDGIKNKGDDPYYENFPKMGIN